MPSNRLISRLHKIDWDFPGTQSGSPFSAIHWHPARLPSQIAAACIGVLSEPGNVVLDPFLGSGTVCVEAQWLDRPSIGFDINPIACKITGAKTLRLSASQIRRVASSLRNAAFDLLQPHLGASVREPSIPDTVQGKWYTDRVRQQLGFLWGLVSETRGASRVLSEAAFSAILLPICRETRHWGYVCDNSTPKGNHEGDPIQDFCRVLDRIQQAYQERDLERKARNAVQMKPQEASICCGDSRDLLRGVPDGSVDLVVTSPPYFGVSDYIKSQRLSAEWFGVEIEPLRQKEIGARSKRHRLTAEREYLHELRDIFSELRRCLKPDAACVVIIGESLARDSVVPRLVRSIAKVGFDKALQRTRRVSLQRRQRAIIETETVLIFQS
jgi:DNA modification methylase